jgi:hypothetical protein
VALLSVVTSRRMGWAEGVVGSFPWRPLPVLLDGCSAHAPLPSPLGVLVSLLATSSSISQTWWTVWSNHLLRAELGSALGKIAKGGLLPPILVRASGFPPSLTAMTREKINRAQAKRCVCVCVCVCVGCHGNRIAPASHLGAPLRKGKTVPRASLFL